MNRANIGNVVTNGMQILSVGATTASKIFLGKADSALNNLSEEEKTTYYKMKADKMRDEMNEYYGEKEETKEVETFDNPRLALNSPQGKAIKTKIGNDVNWQEKYKQDISKIEKALQPLYNKFKEGGTENANV